MKECYKDHRFSSGLMSVIRTADRLLTEQQRDGFTITLRGLYYMFISQDLFPSSWIDLEYNHKHGLPDDTKNTEKNYKRLGGLISDARLAGHIDWSAIEDRGRRPNSASSYADTDHVVSVVKNVVSGFEYDRWRKQPHYVELWVEKDALAGYLTPLVDKHHVTLMVNKGYSSQSAMYEAAERFREALSDGKDPVLIYMGDFDPSGEDMVRDIRDRLWLFGAGVSDNEEHTLVVKKIALTMDQIRSLDLPPNPAKVTDSRAAKYIERFGDKSWELDALQPRMLVKLAEDEIKKFIDADYLNEVLDEQEEDRKKMMKLVERMGV